MVAYALFDIGDRSALRAALGAAARRSPRPIRFAEPVGIGRGRLPRVAAPLRPVLPGDPVPVWQWEGLAGELAESASELLRELVFPLTHGDRPFCIAFPFSESELRPQPLDPTSLAKLDIEDTGRLLGEAPHGATASQRPPAWAPAGAALEPPVFDAAGSDHRFDEHQRRAVEHHDGPQRVLAPAGSGKTKTMIGRVVELVRRGVPAQSILVLAFNTKAAEQLEERLARLGVPTTRRLLGDASHGVHCATFNAFGYRYQREVAGGAAAVCTDRAALQRLLRAALVQAGVLGAVPPAALSGGSRAAEAAFDDVAWRFQDALTRVCADFQPAASLEVRLPPTWSGGSLLAVPFAPVEDVLRRLQRRQGVQSFDDQVYLAVVDLLLHPARRRLLQDRFTHLLIDEFQDLNGAQLALTDILSRPHRRLFVVGDDDQLIYGWRFARPESLLVFPQRMPEGSCATHLLATNYRCSRQIVERADRLIRHNRVRVTKEIRCRPDAPPGAVILCAAAHWHVRAAALVEFLQTERQRLRSEWSELAVLCRYRSQQAPVAAALERAGVPHSPLLPCRLFTHPAARLLRACLALTTGDTTAAPGAHGNGRLHGVTGVATPLSGDPQPHDLARELGLPLPTLLARTGDLRRWVARERPSAGEAVAEIVADLGLDGWAARAVARPRRAVQSGIEEGGPAQVLDAALLLAHDHVSLAAYVVAWDTLAAREGAAPAERSSAQLGAGVQGPFGAADDEDGVVMTTIHAAKGREYASVAIFDYAPDLSALDDAGLEEERRVLYVALTRAKHAALLTMDTHKRAPHLFIAELAMPPPRAEARALRRRLRALEEAGGDPAEQLRLRGRLTEYDLFRERSPLSRVTAAVGMCVRPSAR